MRHRDDCQYVEICPGFEADHEMRMSALNGQPKESEKAMVASERNSAVWHMAAFLYARRPVTSCTVAQPRLLGFQCSLLRNMGSRSFPIIALWFTNLNAFERVGRDRQLVWRLCLYVEPQSIQL